MKVNIKKGQLTILIIPFYSFLSFTILFIFFFPGLEGFYGFLELIQKFLLWSFLFSMKWLNRPCHGFRRHPDEKENEWEIKVFVWESNVE